MHKATLDAWALFVAILSLVVSGITAFCTTLQPAKVGVEVGKKVLFNAYPRLGLSCGLTNSGAQQTWVSGVTLDWDQPSERFELAFISSQLEQWMIGEDGKRKTVTHTLFTIPNPIAVGAHDQKTVFLWLQPKKSSRDFTFLPGRHSCRLVVYRWSQRLAEYNFGVEIPPNIAERLKSDVISDYPVERPD